MAQTEKYYVVRRIEEKDELFATIDAMSLDEAVAIFEIRYKEEIEQLGTKTYYIFPVKEELQFDESNRLVFPKGKMHAIHSIIGPLN